MKNIIKATLALGIAIGNLTVGNAHASPDLGSVPLRVIEKLAAERPATNGVALPGMPICSLRMDFDKKAKYKVISLQISPFKTTFEINERGV
ncbi:MAG: DUF411 domain-containing protein [Salaquimonas sp.]